MGETLERYIAVPIYCRQCSSSNTFERTPKTDIVSESGKTLWERWTCRKCGSSTIRPPDGKILAKGSK